MTAYTETCNIPLMNRKKKTTQWNSQQVLALRQHMGLTQSELADKLGTRQQTISEWEKGMYTPRGASAKLLSIVAEEAQYPYQAGPVKKKPPDRKAKFSGKPGAREL